jgi:hypothetical protein
VLWREDGGGGGGDGGGDGGGGGGDAAATGTGVESFARLASSNIGAQLTRLDAGVKLDLGNERVLALAGRSSLMLPALHTLSATVVPRALGLQPLAALLRGSHHLQRLALDINAPRRGESAPLSLAPLAQLSALTALRLVLPPRRCRPPIDVLSPLASLPDLRELDAKGPFQEVLVDRLPGEGGFAAVVAHLCSLCRALCVLIMAAAAALTLSRALPKKCCCSHIHKTHTHTRHTHTHTHNTLQARSRRCAWSTGARTGSTS